MFLYIKCTPYIFNDSLAHFLRDVPLLNVAAIVALNSK